MSFQLIWDEVGESDEDRDKMLLQLEQECLDVYRRKVDQASNSRARLLQQLANAKSELSRLLCALGELSISGIVSILINIFMNIIPYFPQKYTHTYNMLHLAHYC